MNMTVVLNENIASGIYRMRLSGDTRKILRPGQFAQISVPGFFLRRPISVCDCETGENGTLDIVYKVVGRGTEALSEAPEGTTFDMLLGLGNGYDISNAARPLIAGGGVGAPPLYYLCRRLVESGVKPTVALGFNSASDVILVDDFERLGASVLVSTVDGSLGQKGFVTDVIAPLADSFDSVFACGPEPMLKAVHTMLEPKNVRGQYSFEERMACGFGACMGCSRKVKGGYKRICKDGPVLRGEEIIW